MAKLMGMLNLYREELKASARALDQEGLSQGAIAKELGVDNSTISRWLNSTNGEGQLVHSASFLQYMQNALAKSPTRSLVVCQAVERLSKQ